jgi:glycerol uptake facilitator protein
MPQPTQPALCCKAPHMLRGWCRGLLTHISNFAYCHILSVTLRAGLGGPTGYAANPARDLGPRLAHTVLPIPDKGHSKCPTSPVS